MCDCTWHRHAMRLASLIHGAASMPDSNFKWNSIVDKVRQDREATCCRLSFESTSKGTDALHTVHAGSRS